MEKRNIMAKRINGIQQLGVGVTDVQDAFKWYRTNFGMDIKMFEEAAMAELMLPHTDGQPRSRHAILALNMIGGGGFEIWQHTGKTPESPKFEIQIGDLGICIGKLRSLNVHKTYSQFTKWGIEILTQIDKDPSGNEHFYVKDLYGNVWEIVNDTYKYQKTQSETGGVFGVVIGVTDMDASLKVYRDILNYDTIIYDVTD